MPKPLRLCDTIDPLTQWMFSVPVPALNYRDGGSGSSAQFGLSPTGMVGRNEYNAR